MRKRNIALISATLSVIIVATVTTCALTRPTATTQKSPSSAMAYADAKRLPLAAKCLEKNSAVAIPASERSTVEMGGMSHLYDVPAGTNVDILIASYSKDQVTGSSRYPAKYGSYNFTMNKQPNGDWQYTKFEHCY